MISLVFFGDLKYCPYLKRYTEQLDLLGQEEYEVLFWNRAGEKLKLSKNFISFEEKSDLIKNKVLKLYDFIKAREWFIERLKLTKPDKIILLSTLSGIFLIDFILGSKVKYVLDIRDYSYEAIKLFSFLEKKLIKGSMFTVISSKGFKAFLPKHNYIITHNFNRNELKFQRSFIKKEYNKPLNIVWNGAVRFFEFQKKYLDILKNDCRFNIIYHGDGPELELYKNYCANNGFTNVIFTGTYCNDDKYSLLEDADIINNAYGYSKNSELQVKFAVSNRFYDGLIIHRPQLVEPNGFKTDLIKKMEIGCNYMPENDLGDKLYEYYQNIDVDKFNDNCDRMLDMVLAEDNIFIDAIERFIMS